MMIINDIVFLISGDHCRGNQFYRLFTQTLQSWQDRRQLRVHAERDVAHALIQRRVPLTFPPGVHPVAFLGLNYNRVSLPPPRTQTTSTFARVLSAENWSRDRWRHLTFDLANIRAHTFLQFDPQSLSALPEILAMLCSRETLRLLKTLGHATAPAPLPSASGTRSCFAVLPGRRFVIDHLISSWPTCNKNNN